MKNWLGLSLGALVLGFALGFWWWTSSNAQSPFYASKPLNAWALQARSPDPVARQQAGEALKAMGSRAIPGLVRLLRAKDSLLSKTFWRPAHHLPKPIKELVLRHLRPPVASARRVSAAQALALIGPGAAPAVPALARALHDPVPEVGWEAAKALARIGRAGVPALTNALQAPDPSVRRSAAYALGEVGAEAASAVPALIESLSDSDLSVRLSAVGSLRSIGQPATPALLEVVRNGSGQGRIGAAQALVEVCPWPRIVRPALLTMLDDPSPAVREQAALTLAKIGTNGAVHQK